MLSESRRRDKKDWPRLYRHMMTAVVRSMFAPLTPHGLRLVPIITAVPLREVFALAAAGDRGKPIGAKCRDERRAIECDNLPSGAMH